MTAPDQTNAEVSDERLREIKSWAAKLSTWSRADGHPSPEFYGELASVLNELLNRRSVTSQASEGETKSLIERLARNFAVAYVDGRHGYTMEFAQSPASHRDEYDEAESYARIVLETEFRWEPALSAPASPSKRVERLETAHPDDIAVDRFAAAMKAKLAKKRAEGRRGWQDKFDCTREFLSQILRGHVEKGDPLDVGNLAMMLYERGETIADAGAITSWVEREADRNMGLPR